MWVSPGQWGSVAFFGFLMICVGSLVVRRAERSDVTLAFIASWIALVVGRSLWLGEPLAIPLHRLENGALLLFTFFMISDPRTTPDSRAGRIIFAALVALGAYCIPKRASILRHCRIGRRKRRNRSQTSPAGTSREFASG